MRKGIIMMAILLVGSLAYGQKGEMNDEKVKQLRIAFLTEELDLSVEEGQQFWPIYNEFEAAKSQIDAEMKSTRKESKQNKAPSAAEVEQGIRQMAELKRELASLEENYMLDCLPVLGPEKTVRLAKAERKFKKKLLEHVQKGRPGGGPGRRE